MKVKSMIAATIAVFGVSAGAETVHADASLVGETRHVAYGDLNLDSDKGAKVFYGRVKNAARDVCSPLERHDLGLVNNWQRCYDNAVESAIASVNKSKVTALHRRVVKTPPMTLASNR